MTNDLISRTQAIDAVMDEFKRIPTSAIRAKTRIEALPSAQPEIIRCKACKYYVKEHGWNCIEYTVCSISPLHHPLRKPNDFCSRAERRTDDGD